MTGTNYQKLLNVVTPSLDELYVVIRDIQIAFQVDNARGKSLENIGALLDFPRTVGESDAVYRERLKNIIFINTIAGTKLAIQKLLSAYLLIPITQIQIKEPRANHIVIWLPPECQVRDADLRALVKRSVAAGIYVGFYYNVNYWDVSKWDSDDAAWC